jgi:hypothetical protein
MFWNHDLKQCLLSSLFMLLLLPGNNYAAENVVLITLDGLRWQEVFAGVDEELATHQEYSSQSEELIEKFWHETPEERAEALLPFINGTVFSQGAYAGNRQQNSCAAVSNDWYFSYPGYSEILTGVVNPDIVSNSKIPNSEATFLELLESNSMYQGKTAAFASWDVFPFIFNVERSGIHVNAFSPEANPADSQEEFLNNLQNNIPPPWPTVRNDAFTHQFALSYLRREQPKVLFIGYGETDDFAHDGKYDEYIFAANRTDRFIEEIWLTLQSIDQYRNNTALFITVDHGRGELPLETWKHHSSRGATTRPNSGLTQYADGIAGSEATWFAAIGAGINNRGEIQTESDCITSNRIAASLMQLIGEDYRDYNPAMGAPIQELFE